MVMVKGLKKNISLVKAITLGALCAGSVKGMKFRDQVEYVEANTKSLLADEKGEFDISSAPGFIVSFLICIAIGALIFAKVMSQIIGTDDASNETIASIKSTGWAALGLIVLGALVLAAVIILSIVKRM